MPSTNPTRVYEAMFLIDTGDAAVWDDLTKHIESILARSGGLLIGITRWDERKLAYPVGKHKRGTYVLAFFHMASGDGVTEIERDCQLSERIVRTLVLKADHFTVADMRQQLGEDIREEEAQKVYDMRGEAVAEAAAAAAAAARAEGDAIAVARAEAAASATAAAAAAQPEAEAADPAAPVADPAAPEPDDAPAAGA
ncbi:MAG TPA: 30S ribosomal protein S6 [Phycisphaerae bacterium]|nr:30S ribosomal protein S6 [Phycisphaerae bacterium]